MAIQTGDYHALVTNMQAQSSQQRLPLRAMFELTYRCNFACIHCYNSASQKASKSSEEVSTRDACLIIDQIRDLGCFVLGFTGGEVFVRPDAMEIFQYAKRSGFQVIIYTNGYYINESIADELAALAPNKVDISIHGKSAQVFERITQRPGSRDRVFRAIELLVERGVRVGLKSNLFADNADEMAAIKQFADSIGAFHRLSSEFFARNDRSPEPYRYQLEPEEVHRILEELYPKQQNGASQIVSRADGLDDDSVTQMPENHMPRSAAPLFHCGVGRSGLVVTPFGEVKPCLEFDQPTFSIKEYSLAGCWEKIVEFTDQVNATEDCECHTCELEPHCDSCPASRYLATGSVAKCDPYARRKAEFKRSRVGARDSAGVDRLMPGTAFVPVFSSVVAESAGGCGSCAKSCS